MNPLEEFKRRYNRRAFLSGSTLGLGSIAAGTLLGDGNLVGAAEANALPAGDASAFATIAPKAKRVI